MSQDLSTATLKSGLETVVSGVARHARPGLLTGLLLAASGGCSKPPAGDAAPAASAPAASATMAAATPSTSAAAQPSGPIMKEYSDPPADRIGTLAPGTGIPVGQKVPDIHARDLDGKDVSLSSLYTKGPILLAFYRGGWCPYL